MKVKQVKDLVRVTEAGFLAAQSRLLELRQREAALRDQLQSLKDARKRLSETDRSSGDAALSAGADAMWLRWISGRQAAINAELTEVQVLKAQQSKVVKLAFGRRQAAQALEKKALLAAIQERERRSWL